MTIFRRATATAMAAVLLASPIASADLGDPVVPVVSAPQPLTRAEFRGASPDAHRAAIASDGSGYLAVWQACGVDPSDPSFWTCDVFGRWLDELGRPTHTELFSIWEGQVVALEPFGGQPTAAGAQAVAWNGTNYLVVFEHYGTGDDSNLVGRLVAPDAFDSTDAFDGVAGQSPSVSSDGDGFLVTWQDGSTVEAMMTDATGAQTVAPFTVATGTGGDPAWNGTHYVITYDSGDANAGTKKIFAKRYEADGTSVDESAPLEIGTGAGDRTNAHVAAQGPLTLIIWDDAGVGKIRGRFLEDGTMADPTFDIQTGGIGNNIAARGAGFIVTWGGTNIGHATIATDGTVTPGVAQMLPVSEAPVASVGTISQIVWANDQAYGAALLSNGTYEAGAPRLLSSHLIGPEAPSLAFNGTNFAAVWADGRRDSGSKLWGARFDPSGERLHAEALDLVSDAADMQRFPQLVWTGDSYTLIWLNTATGAIMRTTLDASLTADNLVGVVLVAGDAVPVKTAPRIAWSGSGYLVVWRDNSDGSFQGQRFDEGFEPIDDSPIDIAPADPDPRSDEVAVVWNGTHYLVSYTELDDPSGAANQELRVVPVPQEGLLGSPKVWPAPTGQFLATAVGGGRTLVTWNGGNDIWGALVDAAGNEVVAPFAINDVDPLDALIFPEAVWDGTNFFVTWTDTNTQGTRAARVTREGVVHPIAESLAARSASATIAAGSGERIAMIDSRFGKIPDGIDTDDMASFYSTIISPARPTTPAMKAQPRFRLSLGFPVKWTPSSGGEGGLASYQLSSSSATHKTGLSGYGVVAGTLGGTARTIIAKPGRTYCFRTRARSGLGYLSGTPTPACTATPVDDLTLKASRGWKRTAGKAFYLRTATTTSAKGRTLTLSGVRAKRLVLVASKCRRCGTVKVMLGKKLLKKVSLKSARTKHKQQIPIASFARLKKGTVKIVVVSSGKSVKIDGLGVSAV